MSRSLQAFLVLACLLLFSGMGTNPAGSGAQLKPEIRLKIYNEAIRHYEKAKTLHAEARPKEALQELHKATRVIRAFPEAYQLAQQIYTELGDAKAAAEQAELFKTYVEQAGSSLYQLRDEIARVVRAREKMAPPPDFPAGGTILFCLTLAGLILAAMIVDSHRHAQSLKQRPELILGDFPSEDEIEVAPSWIFKLCLFLIPAPLIVLLLVALGIRHYSDLLPILLFSWVLVDAVLYLLFFADLSDLGGSMRRPG